jgi:aminomethyltransferase
MYRILLTRCPSLATTTRGLSSSGVVGGEMKKTAFYDQHVKAGGKIVEFAGYALPVQYEGAGVLAEHLHTRSKVSIFDVSHMGQVRIDGKKRVQFLESLVVADLASLKEGQAKLSLLTNSKGGIVDDTVISNAGDHLYVVVNGACKEKDLAHFEAALKLGDDLKITHMTNLALLALQGPKAATVLSSILEKKDAASLPSMIFMTGKRMKVAGLDCRVTRCGYTGEDGFEISVENASAPKLLDALLEADKDVRLAGLGARDSLRLEAGLCLYGHDIDEKTDPIEAALTWTISKSRRESTAIPFTGSSIILPKITQKPSQKRIGLFVNGAPARGM